VLAITRNSNSMDAALLVGDLVFVLEAYKAAEDPDRRLILADGILQGLSADPELFLTRTDVLGPCTMIEEVFIERSRGGAPQYTPFGDAHLAHLTRYRALIAELREALIQDALTLRAGSTTYSTLGIAYGFCADILTNMAIDGLLSRPGFGLSLEDMFVSGRHVESKVTRACGWEKLPSKAGEREHFEHSLDWAAQVFERTLAALSARGGDEPGRLPSGRLFVIPESHRRESSAGTLPDGIVSAQEHYVTSDLPRALASGATAFPKSRILLNRKQGRFLASAEVDGKWFGVSKVLLTACLWTGKGCAGYGCPRPGDRGAAAHMPGASRGCVRLRTRTCRSVSTIHGSTTAGTSVSDLLRGAVVTAHRGGTTKSIRTCGICGTWASASCAGSFSLTD